MIARTRARATLRARYLLWAAVLAATAFGGSAALAGHVPVALDVPVLWTPVPGSGYIEFINPVEHPALIGVPVFTTPPGAIFTEEHTGFTTALGVGIIELGDSDVTHGDKADFDWVQENRPDEFAGISNHPGLIGAMGWTPGTPEMSPHIDLGTGAAHGHSVEEAPPGPLPVLIAPAYADEFFSGVDVFSQITLLDGELTVRDAALDYIVDFGNTITGFATTGVPIIVFVPGWTAVTGIDDYVTRWVPAVPGLYDVVAIEPSLTDSPFEFQVTEIDAIMAWVPEPSALVLAGLGALGVAIAACQRARR